MPSFDVSSYTDLTIYDLNSQDIYLQALQYARLLLPEFEPVDGSIETVLLQAMALEVQDLVTSINRLPGGIVQALLGLIGIPKKEATKSTGIAKFTANGSLPFSLDAGTRLFSRNTIDSAKSLYTVDAINLSLEKAIASGYRLSNTVYCVTSEYHGLLDGEIVTTSMAASGGALSGTAVTITVTGPKDFSYTKNGADVPASGSNISAATDYVTASEQDPYGYGSIAMELPGNYFVAAGEPLTFLTSVPQVASVELVTDVTGGIDSESDISYAARASASLNRMTSALVTAEQIGQYLVSLPEFGYVYRVKAVDNMNASKVENSAGYTYLFVAKIAATPDNQISALEITSIGDTLSPLLHPALTVTVDNPWLFGIDLEATVHAVSNFSATEVENSVIAALQSYINSDNWDWGATLRQNEIEYVIRNANIDGMPTVSYVSSIDNIAISSSNSDIVTGIKNEGTYTASRDAFGVLTVTVTSGTMPEDIGTFSTWVYLYDAAYETSAVWKIVDIAGSTFTVQQPVDYGVEPSLSGNWSILAKQFDAPGQTGDIEFTDPAVLLNSGTYTINVS